YYLNIAINRWPGSPHWNDFIKAIATAYKKKNDTASAAQWLAKLHTDKGKALADLLGQKGPFKTSQDVKIFLSALKRHGVTGQKLANLFDSGCKDQFDIAQQPLRNLDYENALNEYLEIKRVFLEAQLEVPTCVDSGIKAMQLVM